MPVTTRRQSGKLPQPNLNAMDEGQRNHVEDVLLAAAAGIDDDDDPMDGPLAELSSSEYGQDGDGMNTCPESDSSEFGEGTPHTPTAKRRKLEKASPPKVKTSGLSRRVRGRLENMLSLPLDVLFVLLSELQPMDLLNLARTSKTLRQVLMSRKSMSVWIAARRNAGATVVPEPPEDMSEPAWAQLLFGPAICSQCSARNIHRVDFALRRRLCTVCRKRNLVFSIKFRSQCPDLKESVMDLLPYTKIGGWAHGHASNSRFYWKPDLYEMGRRMAEIEKDVSEGKPGAQKRFKTFRAERILLVDSIIQGCAPFEEWAEIEADAQRVETEKRRTDRQEALRDHILKAGYEDADIDHISLYNIPGSNVDKVLTEDAWRRIKTKVLSALSSARENRLLEDWRRRENQNKSKAEQYYTNVLRQVLPMQRLYLPNLSQAFELSCFKDLIDPDREAQLADWEHAATLLPQCLSEWMSGQKERLISLLPCQSAQANAMEIILLSSPSVDRWRHEVMPNFAGELNLATSVFRHLVTDMFLFGRDACHAWKIGRLDYSPRGAEAVRALLEVLQLDPASTTPSMLDQLGKQFSCGVCTQKQPTWRSCVTHFIYPGIIDHEFPQWEVLSPDEMLPVVRERTFPIAREPFQTASWLCNHCSDYLAPQPPFPFGCRILPGSRVAAIHHVKTEHNIDDPVEDVNFFLYPISGGDMTFL
ncbi:hypothetical protein EI94DRAFT_1737300 [Lactarius quietus]|nr:hypothetical protein EI94DRAFT_1737300 [Lactarius quietus]